MSPILGRLVIGEGTSTNLVNAVLDENTVTFTF